jgi:outer membrane lipoprotein SlyB
MTSLHRLMALALTATALSLAAGCAAPSRSGSVYSDRDARQPMQIQTGTIQGVREVRIERAQPTGVGTAAGAVVGGVAGSTVGGGGGRSSALSWARSSAAWRAATSKRTPRTGPDSRSRCAPMTGVPWRSCKKPTGSGSNQASGCAC